MKYIARPIRNRPRADDYEYWDTPPETARTVHEPEPDTFTGLYDSAGNELHRTPRLLGFCRD